MPKAPASSRAYEFANFSFGLVSIPLAVFSASNNEHGISRKMVRPVPLTKTVTNPDGTTTEEVVTRPVLDESDQPVLDEQGQPKVETVYVDHAIGYASLDKETGEVVERSEVVRKVVTEHGLVFVEDHEIEQLLTLEPKTIKVLAFQPQHLFFSGVYVPRKQYFVEAERTKVGKTRKPNKAAERALAMVLKAMKAEGCIALVEFTTRGVPQPAVLLPTGVMWIVHHEEEMREQRPLPEVEIDEALLAQARMLLKTKWSADPVELTDRRTSLIQAFAEEKAAAGDFDRPEADVEIEGLGEATDDLMAALMKSMNMGQGDEAATA